MDIPKVSPTKERGSRFPRKVDAKFRIAMVRGMKKDGFSNEDIVKETCLPISVVASVDRR